MNDEVKEKIEKLFSCYRVSYRRFLTSKQSYYVELTDPLTGKTQECTLFFSMAGAVLMIPTNNGSLEILIDERKR